MGFISVAEQALLLFDRATPPARVFAPLTGFVLSCERFRVRSFAAYLDFPFSANRTSIPILPCFFLLSCAEVPLFVRLGLFRGRISHREVVLFDAVVCVLSVGPLPGRLLRPRTSSRDFFSPGCQIPHLVVPLKTPAASRPLRPAFHVSQDGAFSLLLFLSLRFFFRSSFFSLRSSLGN